MPPKACRDASLRNTRTRRSVNANVNERVGMLPRPRENSRYVPRILYCRPCDLRVPDRGQGEDRTGSEPLSERRTSERKKNGVRQVEKKNENASRVRQNADSPVFEQRRIPIHVHVSEVLEYRREVDPKHAVVFELSSLHIVFHSPAQQQYGVVWSPIYGGR